MNLRDVIILIALVAAIGIYIDLRFSGLLGKSDTIIVRDTTSVYMPAQVYNFPPGKPVTIINQPIPADIDTMSIVRAYFTQYTYVDSLVNDTVSFVLSETISENAIRDRKLSWRLKLPLQTITEIHQHEKARIMLGGIAQYNSVSPAVGYLNKKQQLFFAAYDPWNETVRLGGFVPLGR